MSETNRQNDMLLDLLPRACGDALVGEREHTWMRTPTFAPCFFVWVPLVCRAHAEPQGKVTSSEISLFDFIGEYRQRVFVVKDEIVWQQSVDSLDADAVCCLLQQVRNAKTLLILA